ncbi:presqualene diphosphate synthase HpnD [Candidatus Vallotia cooleyia]|uniref:presqualene diphosphate synthase HpnD n=1 Tax=Candidatus Vallotiella adelgis TaxID=1177211 RepID=UPI001EEF815F|nr:presqualene diphosphate synthase HpnD [Candidatus Vallotia cooleyia]
MRILPKAQREGMYEIYSFCHQVDNVADSGMSREHKLTILSQWRSKIAALYVGNIGTQLEPLSRVVQRFSLRQNDFIAIIDGMEMDVVNTVVAPDRNTLDLYCDRVASAVGRLSVKVFGMPDDDGLKLAHHLGRALQLTNILRDIDEDAAVGRFYLPRDMLVEAGLTHLTPYSICDESLDRACAPLIANAREHFSQATKIMRQYPRYVVIAPRIMAQVYYALLKQLVQRGFAVPRKPVRVSRTSLMLAIVKHYLF